MSRKARGKLTEKINSTAKRRLLLEDIDREYSLYEIAIASRAAQASSLGLTNKGHLGVGADADIAIYNIDLRKTDPAKDYIKARKAFRQAAYTIKDGEVMVKDGEVIKADLGRTYWVKTSLSDERRNNMLSNISDRFKEYYTVEIDNYAIDESYLARPQAVISGG
jgi:formylmethanofuran dehydrogenase subunit A